MPAKNLSKKKFAEGDFFLISDLAELLHVSTHTIRNLEKDYSIEVKKDVNGKRVYVFSDVEKYRKLLDKKNEFEHRIESESLRTTITETSTIPVSGTNKINRPVIQPETAIPHRTTLLHNFHSLANSFKTMCKFSLAMFLIVSFTSYGSFLLDKYLDLPINLLGSGERLYSRNNVSNVLQSTDENWEYRFDVNIPAYFNSTLFSSEASIDLIRVGTNVTITPEGVFAPNVINSINTLPGESLLLVDITDPNNPVLSVQNNPAFATLEIGSLIGVTEVDNTTISTLETALNIAAPTTDAETLQGLAAADFLRSNANTTYTNGIMTFDASSSLKFNNINPSKFLRVDSTNNLVGYDILPGTNVNFSSTATSLTINVNAIATSSQSSSVAVGTLFLGGTDFVNENLILSTAQELNKLHTLSGNIITTSNFNSTLLTSFVNIDTDATNDITTSNLTSSLLSSFPNLDTDATNDVLISSLAALMLSNYPNLDTNALDDVDLLQDAVLVTTGSAKNVYSINTWFGYQNFTNISGSLIEVEENGKILINPGVIPSSTNNSVYNYNDRLYFEELPLIQVSSHLVSDHANKFGFFTTDASNRLLLTGTSNINLSYLQTGASSSILGMDGSTLRYLAVGGDLSVSTTSSSTITFNLNNVNSTVGTFGGSFAVPVITVNSKGQVTSITTTPFNDYYTSNISFSVPSSGSRTLRLQQNGLADLTSTFTLLPSDITSALGYIPLRNTTDSLTGNFGVSGNFSAASASFNSIALSNALSVNYGGTGLTQTPANGQLIIGNAGGYSLSSLISGTNISILTGPGSITISSTDTTNPNNYVTAISFSTPQATQRTLTLTREGLSNLTATFSISSSDITTALGYTPLKNTTDTLTGNLGVSGNFSASLGSFSTLNATNSSIGTLTLTNALGIIYGGTGLTQTPANGQLLIGNAGGYSLSTLIAGSNVQITTGAGSITISSTDTTNPNNYVTAISFSTPQATQRTLTLTREGLSNLTATFSISSSDITTALGYTPLKNTTDSLTGNLGVSGEFSAGASTLTSLGVTNAFSAASGFITNAFGIGGAFSAASGNIINNFEIGGTLGVSNAFSAGASILNSLGVTNAFSAASGSITNNFGIGGALGVTGAFSAGSSTLTSLGVTNAFSAGSGNITNAFGVGGAFSAASAVITNALSAGSIGTTGSLSAATGTFTTLNATNSSIGTLTLTNALGIIYGGTGLTQTPANGQLLIGNSSGGYTLASLVAGTNVQITNASGSITINSTDTNNFVSSIAFSTPFAGQRIFTLQRTGLSDLTTSFTLSTADITTALGYTPVNKAGDSMAGNLTFYNYAMAGTDLTVGDSFYIGDYLNNANNLQIEPNIGNVSRKFVLDLNSDTLGTNATMKLLIRSVSFSTPFSGADKNLTFNFLSSDSNVRLDITKTGTIPAIDANVLDLTGVNLTAATATIQTLQLSNALGVSFGGTGLTQTPANGQLLIGNAGGYSLATLVAGSNVQITTGAGSISISSTDTTNPNNYVTGISFSTPGSGQRTLVLQRDLLSDLTANFSLNLSDITTALGYTPLKNTTDFLTGDFGVSGAFSAGAATLTSLGVTNSFSASTGSITGSFAVGNLSVPSSATLGVLGSGYFTGGLDIGGNTYVNNGSLYVLNGTTVLSSLAIGSLSADFNLDVTGTARVTGSFSAGATTISSLQVTNSISAPIIISTSGLFPSNYRIQTDSTRTDNRAVVVYQDYSSRNGASNIGVTSGEFIQAYRAGPTLDSGSAAWLVGSWLQYGHLGSFPSASNNALSQARAQTTSVIGVSINPYHQYGTISFLSGLFINDPAYSATTVTAAQQYPIYSEWNAPSYFAGRIGIGTADPAYNLEVIGTGRVSGNFSIGGTLGLGTGGTAANAQAVCRNSSTGVLYFSSSNCITSSIRYKENVKDMSYSLTDIEKLRPVEYNYINYDPLDTKQTKNRIGFIAEEMQNVIPEVVFKNDYGEIEGLDYMFLTALLTKGIQEQQVQIQNLSNAVSSLNVSSLETLVESLNNTLDSLSMSTENGALVINSGLTVTGEALFNNATFTGDVAIGQMKFDSLNNDISINGMPCTNIDGTLNESLCNTQTLFVMKNKAGNINFFDGKVLINPNGEMTLEKITVGEVAAAKVSASEYEVMAGSDISGNTKILTGQNEVTILTSKVKENSKIFITPTGSLEGSSIYVDSKLGGVSFTVKLSSPLSKEIEFDWFILNSE